jgi:hypothetical protein
MVWKIAERGFSVSGVQKTALTSSKRPDKLRTESKAHGVSGKRIGTPTRLETAQKR